MNSKEIEQIRLTEVRILQKEEEILKLIKEFNDSVSQFFKLINEPIVNDKNVTININVINNNIKS